MASFSIERASNKQFYARFKAGNNTLVWDTLPDLYKQKTTAFKAVAILAVHFNVCEVTVVDNTGKKPVHKKLHFDGTSIYKIEIVNDAKS